MPVYLLIKKAVWGQGYQDGVAWQILRGRRYKTRQAAEAARKRLYEAIRRAAEAGRVAPDYPERWLRDTAVVEVRAEDDAISPLRREGLPGQLITTSTLLHHA